MEYFYTGNDEGRITSRPLNAPSPSVQRTLYTLYKTYLDLLVKHTYKTINVVDITNRAKVHRSTFYKYFRNMYDFIYFCTRTGFREELDRLFPLETLNYDVSSVQKLVNWTFVFIKREYLKWHYRWEEIIFESALRQEFYFFLIEWFDLRDQVKFESHAQQTVYAMSLSAAVTGLGMEWCHGDCKATTNKLAEQITRIFLLNRV